MRHGALAIVVSVVCATAPAPGGVVLRHGGLPPIEAPVIAMDDAGVTVRTPGGESQVIAWDVVRDIAPDELEPSLPEALAKVSEELWRARSRLQRNDPGLAEPLFERLFARYRGQTSESALIVAEGLLRCRLARGANEMAVIPYLEETRLRRAGVTTDRYAALTPVFDSTWDLCPELAPAWLDPVALEKLQRDLGAYDAQGDAVVAGLAATYRLAVRLQAYGPSVLDEADRPAPPSHEGIRLIETLAETMSRDQDRRTSARNRLLNRIPELPDWAEPWIRYQVGVSLLSEDDVEAQRRGMVDLAHLPARFGGTQPYLTGLATARLASELAARGRTEEAAALRAEIQRRFPGHPVLMMNDDGGEPSDRHKENA